MGQREMDKKTKTVFQTPGTNSKLTRNVVTGLEVTQQAKHARRQASSQRRCVL